MLLLLKSLLACALLVATSNASTEAGSQISPAGILGRRQTSSSGSDTPIISTNEEPDGILNATAWALIYTYPLAIFSSWSGGVLRNGSVNEIYHQRQLASPDNPGVIKPNVDTLYSRVVLDLSEQDVVLTVPQYNDSRYWNYPIYDPLGNNHAEIGVVNGNQPGDYLIRRAEDQSDQTLGFHNTTSDYNSSAYKGVVNLPGSYATMLIRILLLQNTTQDLNAVHTYQNASSLTAIDRNSSSSTPSLQSLALNGSLLGIDSPAQQLEFSARLYNYSGQSEIYTDRRRVGNILSSAGLVNGNYSQPRNVNLTEAAVIANASITAFVEASANIRGEGNNWQLQTPSNQGNYGTNYASAAYVALAGYQQQTIRQTLYPGYGSLGFTTEFNLAENQSLLLTFSGKPIVEEHGFWSLSAYGADQYLIPNDIYRFEVGDRTYNLTYEDGEQIYGPQANSSRDGPFQILVQPADIQPPANWTNNWLPADTTFTWILRWYVPSPAMTNGSYVYPTVQNITAIRASSSSAGSGGASSSSGSSSSSVSSTATSSAASPSASSTTGGTGTGGAGTGGDSGGEGGGANQSADSSGVAMPMKTGAVGAAALFGAGIVFANL